MTMTIAPRQIVSIFSLGIVVFQQHPRTTENQEILASGYFGGFLQRQYLSTQEVIITSDIGRGNYHFIWVDKSSCQPYQIINCIVYYYTECSVTSAKKCQKQKLIDLRRRLGSSPVFDEVCLSSPCVLCPHSFQFLWIVHS